MQTIDSNTVMFFAGSTTIVISAIFAFYKMSRTFLAKDFVDKAAFDKFVDDQKKHDAEQQRSIERLQNELHSVSTTASEIGIHVQWIKSTLERSPLTGEHPRPGGF